jgi:hypothetical protein
MSSIANLSSASSALSAMTVRAHGHKKGSQLESLDDSSSDTTAAVPAGTQQNLFSSMLQSIEQAIGLQLTAATPAATTTTAANATTTGSATNASNATAASAAASSTGIGAAASTTAAAVSTADVRATATQASISALQKYMNNVPQNLPANRAQLSNLSGSNLSVSA